RRPVDRAAVAHELVDEPGRGEEVGLVGRQDEAARVALLRLVEELDVFGLGGLAAAAPAATAEPAATAATATPAAPAAAAGRRAADRLGEDADHVVELAGRGQAAVEPRRVAGPGADGGAGLALGQEALPHSAAQLLDAVEDQRVDVVVVRVAAGRDEQHRAGR